MVGAVVVPSVVMRMDPDELPLVEHLRLLTDYALILEALFRVADRHPARRGGATVEDVLREVMGAELDGVLDSIEILRVEADRLARFGDLTLEAEFGQPFARAVVDALPAICRAVALADALGLTRSRHRGGMR